MPTSGVFGKGVFGRSRFGGKQEHPSPSAFVQDLYRLEVWTNAGARRAVLPNWESAKWTQTANRPSLLQFTYPFNDEHKDLLVYPNQIRIYDRFVEHIDTLTIAVDEPTRDKQGRLFVAFECDGLMAQLGEEIVASYDSVAAGDTTVIQILDALFALQNIGNRSHIRRGNIHSSIRSTAAICQIENKSILQALHELQSTIGGYMRVSPTGTFTWSKESGSRTGQQIRDNKNLQAVKVRRDYRKIRTRVVAYGKGATPDTRLSVTVNNAAAQSEYGGVIPYPVSFADIDNETELTSRANEVLRRVSRPDRQVSFNAIDLSLATDSRLDYSHEALDIGSRISVIDSQLSETHDTRIAKIERDLFHPMGVTIEVQHPDDYDESTGYAEPHRDILDTIIDLMDHRADETLRDTGKLDADSVWDTTAHDGLLDDWIQDLFGNDATTCNAVADAIRDDLVDSIEGDADSLNDLATATANDSPSIQQLASGLANDATAAATLQAAVDTTLTISTDNPQPIAVAGSVSAGSTGEAADAGHVHGVIGAATPKADTVPGGAGTSGNIADAEHEHPRSEVYVRRFSSPTQPQSGQVSCDIWEDNNDGSGPSGENQMKIYNGGSETWVPFLLFE